MHAWYENGSARRMIGAWFDVRESNGFTRPHRAQSLWRQTFRLFSHRPIPDDEPILPKLFPLPDLGIGSLPQKGVDLSGFPLAMANQSP